MPRVPCPLAVGLSLLVALALPLDAQQSCPAPPALAPSTAKNIFTPQQEIDLGNIEAEQFERNIRVIHDEQLTAHANRVAARILLYLPPTELKIRVILVDLPVVSAFSIAGGRLYVTRKAIAFVRSEDELAGLLGHEMGHALTHQQAIDMTRLFQAAWAARGGGRTSTVDG